MAGHKIAVCRLDYYGRKREVMIAYDEFEERIEVVTVHPLKWMQKQQRIKKQEVDKDMKDSKKSIVNYDPGTDALYIATREGKEEEFIEISPGINVELDSEGRVIGIEILNASDALSRIIEPLYRKRQQTG